jgi:hypothetical protein
MVPSTPDHHRPPPHFSNITIAINIRSWPILPLPSALSSRPISTIRLLLCCLGTCWHRAILPLPLTDTLFGAIGTSPRLVGMKFSCTPAGSHSRTVGTTESICGQTILEFVCFGFERMASPRSPHRTARTPRWNNSRRCSPELFWCLQGVHPGTSPRTRRRVPTVTPTLHAQRPHRR